MRRLIQVVLVALVVVALTGCKPSVIGKWETTQTVQGFTIHQVLDMQKGGVLADEVTTSSGGMSATGTVTGTWELKKSGKKQILTVNLQKVQAGGQSFDIPAEQQHQSGPVEIEKDKIIWDVTSQAGAEKIVLTRVKK
jgi:hypothetical protein